MDILDLISRTDNLFTEDLHNFGYDIESLVSRSTFLVIGGAGSIGQAVCKEIFARKPMKLHVIDINENNLVELVRDIRSSIGYIDGDFKTSALDCGSPSYDTFCILNGPYDFVLNLSALKHVRSEQDPCTLMRLIDVNILNTVNTVRKAKSFNSKNYFCVSTDKAANPVNMMGGSKKIMEMFLMRESLTQHLSMARFANVAFSDGSLLHGFNQRFAKRQPIAAPNDVKRYFVTPQESGVLCLLSCLKGANRDIFFPKLSEKLHLTTFSDIACRYLENLGYEAYECDSEQEARDRCSELISLKKWPCFFFKSDTTGEKDFEEFFTEKETLNLNLFSSIGIIKNEPSFDEDKIVYFENSIEKLKQSSVWKRSDLVALFHEMIPGFDHKETGKFLDQKM
ncbi:MAG: UDP-N-acetylglucosamine 4,6-dehydratase [Verrucomicrobiota bacterium]|nr:UDP-N-acetylglucosamine 4,6-dehydratase [Verrucomicrobiota bacterium]